MTDRSLVHPEARGNLFAAQSLLVEALELVIACLSIGATCRSYSACSLVSFCNTALFTESKGRAKSHAQDLIVVVLGMIAEPTGTDGIRTRDLLRDRQTC